MKLKKLHYLLIIPILFICISASATHFRYASVNWQITSSTPTTRTVQFTHTQSWRKSAFFSTSGTAIGQTFVNDYFYFGDGNLVILNLTVTSENNTEDWMVGTATVTYTYNTTTDVTAYVSGCCRISSLLEGQNDDNYRVNTFVTLSDPNNSSPVTNTPPILYVQTGLPAATVQLNATDPENDPLNYVLATTAQSGLSPAVPSVVNGLISTGLLSVNTSGKPIGSKYAVQVIVSDGAATVPLDFIIQVVGISTPPQFDYSITPVDASIIKVQPGTPVNFKVNAFDTDALSTVSLNSSGIPSGASITIQPGDFNPGNPAQFTFDWTPGIGDLGSYALSFSATDNILVQTITNVNIVVSLAPVFDVPPTPDPAVHNVIAPGSNIAFTAQATDPDVLDVVQIISAKHKMTNADFTTLGASIPLPSPSANTTSTTFSWTPTQAQWGHNHVIFTAEDTYGDQTTHEVPILVNTTPIFTSTPVTSVLATQPYNYLITASDPDVAQGDMLSMKVLGTLPSWLSFSDNGNGTASLTGTPGIGDAGPHVITIQLEDINHHMNSGGIPTQTFTINVIPCTIFIGESVTDLSCAGDNTGAIDISLTGIYGTPTFAWTGPNNFSATTEDISGLEPGTYNLVVTSNLGCSESGTYTITQPDPISAVYSATPILCNGDISTESITVTGGTAPYDVTNQNGGVLVTGLGEGVLFNSGQTFAANYVYTVTDANGCTYIFNADITEPSAVSCSIDLPAAISGGVSGTVYPGFASDITLTANANGGIPGYMYLWSTGESTSSITVSPASTTVYTLTTTDANGCASSCNMTVNVVDVSCGKKGNKVLLCKVPPGNPANAHNICVSSNAVASHLATGSYLGPCSSNKTQLSSNMSFDVFPNPNDGNFTVDLELFEETKITIQVMDMRGNLVYSEVYNENIGHYQHAINLNNISTGIYVVSVSSNEMREVKKINVTR